MQKAPSFLTLLLMISFASVNAVLFTPALPDIARFFGITTDTAQQTITFFLVAYALGQLLYGPLANRYGRKSALYFGIGLQLLSNALCITSGFIHEYELLIVGRFLLALGSGVGLKMAFTLVTEYYEPKIASQKISYLLIGFAVTPALSVSIGGILTTYFSWISCFYAGSIYGFILLFLIRQLPETKRLLNYDALKIKNLFHDYSTQFKNTHLLAGGFLMGGATSFVYVFAALAPFISINLLGMSVDRYGFANLIPTLGLILGSLSSAQLVKRLSFSKIIQLGIAITFMGIMWMLNALWLHQSAVYALFFPMVIIYFGLSFIMANASTFALSQATDKSHGSAVMNFINVGTATLSVLSLGLFNIHILLLPIFFLGLCIAMMGIDKIGLQPRAKRSLLTPN